MKAKEGYAQVKRKETFYLYAGGACFVASVSIIPFIKFFGLIPLAIAIGLLVVSWRYRRKAKQLRGQERDMK